MVIFPNVIKENTETTIFKPHHSAMRYVTVIKNQVGFKNLFAVLILTLLIWATGVVAFMVMFYSMNMQLGWLAGITVLVLTCIGIAMPAAPGFIGNYHYACVVALGLFGVAKGAALAFAILIHFLTMVVLVLMGVVFMNTSKLKVGFPLLKAASGKQGVVGSREQ